MEKEPNNRSDEFDEQVRKRGLADDQALEDAWLRMASVLEGRKISHAMEEDWSGTRDVLAQILRYFHVKVKELPDIISDRNEELELMLQPYGIMRRTVVLEQNWYRNASGALLGILKDGSIPVALLPGRGQSYCWIDPRTGEKVRVNRRTCAFLEEEAICFYRPLPQRELSRRDLCVFLVRTVRTQDVASILCLMAVATLVGLLIPKLSQLLYGQVIESGSFAALMAIGVLMISVSVSSLFFVQARQLVTTKITRRMTLETEAAVMMRILSLPADFFRTYSAAELNVRQSCVAGICGNLTGIVLSTGLTAVFSLVYIGQFFQFTPALAFPAMGILAASAVVSVLTVLTQLRVSRRQLELAAHESTAAHTMITGIQKIRLSGAEKRIFARWADIFAEEMQNSYNPPLFLKISSVISTAISLIGTLVLYAGAIASGTDTADYLAFISAYGLVSGAFSHVSAMAMQIAGLKPQFEMLDPILKTCPEIAGQKKPVSSLDGSVEFSHVSFRYTESQPCVEEDLSLKIHPGEYLAVTGSTGCGKSTLIRLMLGFETPQKGAIFYDGEDLADLDLRSLRRRIGTVLQNGSLFMGSILSNILLTAPWLTEKDAWEAAETACIREDIEAMPMRMQTVISEGSGGISGGQKQRILIARAIAQKPKILIFDEATSALDNIQQKKISDALGRMDCTRIVIAHRLSTIRDADRIVFLENGRITEDGTYEELIRQGGSFARMVARQRLEMSS